MNNRARLFTLDSKYDLVRHLIDLLDRGLESASYAELFGQPASPEFEERMNEAAQALSEEYPSKD
jgi:hypothetical protein